MINTGTTVATFLMNFIIQHSQNRDATAIQAKLDELILVSEASNKLIRAEQLTARNCGVIPKSCAIENRLRSGSHIRNEPPERPPSGKPFSISPACPPASAPS